MLPDNAKVANCHAIKVDFEKGKMLAEAEKAKVVNDGDHSPSGWRIDVFGARKVSSPPWLKPFPTLELEAWICMAPSVWEHVGQKCRDEDPDGYERH